MTIIRYFTTQIRRQITNKYLNKSFSTGIGKCLQNGQTQTCLLTSQQNGINWNQQSEFSTEHRRASNRLRNEHENSTKIQQRIDSLASSLKQKGFLRSYKPYDPPSDVQSKIKTICTTLELTLDSKLDNLSLKFELLDSCQKAFNGHQPPSSVLHELKSVNDVIDFYETKVNTTLPMDAIQSMSLPENLHIQDDYVRFHPETDTMFGGRSAFPKSSTLVTGLKTRKKYKGYEAKHTWH